MAVLMAILGHVLLFRPMFVAVTADAHCQVRW
jgi:hypothetical protein